jgi:hypothetical protein
MYTAVIVEPREHPALHFVLDNVLSNLSEEWNIIIFHGTKNIEYLEDIINVKLSQYKSRITCIKMSVDNLSRNQYSSLLIQPSFYEDIPTETFLIFQTDSMILPKNKDIINDFLEYDYVGAPWNHCPPNTGTDRVGNGGFSLRKKSKMLEIIATKPYKTYAEDVYFCFHPTIKLHKPTMEKAKQFSVENLFHPTPFGCHQPWTLPEQYKKEFYELYPEAYELYKLNHTKN